MNDIEAYVSCPLDVSHRILRSRLQTHLYKCCKNYPKHTKVKCIYDVTHILDVDEYEQHLAICPSSGNVQSYSLILEPERNIGISIQEACNLQTNITEEEEEWFGNTPSYNALATSEKKIVMRPAIAMSKGEKKKFREYERQRLLSLEKENNEKSISKQGFVQKEIGCDEPLRIPKNVAKAVSCNVSTSMTDITSQLKDISINSNNDIPDSEKFCKLNLNNSKTDKQEAILANTSSNKVNTISLQSNNSQAKQKEDILNVKRSTCAMSQNIEMKNDNLEPTNLKPRVNTLEKNLETNNIEQKSSKCYTLESQNGIELSVQRGILHEEPKKVSTGRGFILAYQHSSSNILNRSNKKAGSMSDYDYNGS